MVDIFNAEEWSSEFSASWKTHARESLEVALAQQNTLDVCTSLEKMLLLEMQDGIVPSAVLYLQLHRSDWVSSGILLQHHMDDCLLFECERLCECGPLHSAYIKGLLECGAHDNCRFSRALITLVGHITQRVNARTQPQKDFANPKTVRIYKAMKLFESQGVVPDWTHAEWISDYEYFLSDWCRRTRHTTMLLEAFINE